jgi:hypothetical protein
MILEGSFGESAWRYGAIRAIRARGPWVLIELESMQYLAVRGDGTGEEPLATWLARRAPALARRGLSPSAKLAGLAALHLVLVVTALLILPGGLVR